MADDSKQGKAPAGGDEARLRERDDVRCEVTLQALEDILWRFNESNEGTMSVYDVVGYLVEDLIREGFCAACVSETVAAAIERSGEDPSTHREQEGPLRDPGEVFH